MSEQGYDLIVDYTFFCAIPILRRTWWAENMARLISRENEEARLLTLMFPIEPLWEENEGPPFPVNLERYQAALDPYFELVSFEENTPAIKPRRGREAIGLWKIRK